MSQGVEGMSPLKLYQKAFRLQHKDNKISEAAEIYQKLVREFPECEVSSYAAVQLEKLRVSGAVKQPSAAGGPMAVVALVVATVSVIAVGIFAVILAVHIKTAAQLRENHTLALRAMAKISGGHDEEALDILREMKITSRGDIAPFAISAEIYRNNFDYLRARKEFEAYKRLYPSDNVADYEIAALNREEDGYISDTMEKKKARSMPEDVVKEVDRKVAAKKSPPKRRRVNKVKPKLLIPTDSINYF